MRLKGAKISADGKYRYRLWRVLRKRGPVVVFVMLNPSTADADVDDPTLRRCVSIASTLEASRVEIVNLYAYRTPDPAALFAVEDPIGPGNDKVIHRIVGSAPIIICAWGSSRAPQKELRVPEVWEAIGGFHTTKQVLCLGLCQDGSPKHPLYVRRDQELLGLDLD